MQFIIKKRTLVGSLAFTLLFLLSDSAIGEWRKIAENDLDSFFYISPETIAKNGRNVRVWYLINYGPIHECRIENPTDYEKRKCYISKYETRVRSSKSLMERWTRLVGQNVSCFK